MRVHAYAFLSVTAVTIAATIGACSGDVNTNQNAGGAGGGAGGTGGNVMTTSVSSSSSSSSSSASSSSGGDVCDQACGHVEMCVGFTCDQLAQQFGITIDCSNPQYECIAQCVLDTPCDQLGLNTLQTCGGMCQGDGGPPPMDGGGGDDCTQACDHAQQCTGFNVCSQIPLDCSNPQQACTAACVKNVPCGNGFFQGAQACQQSCQNPGDAGPPPSDGGGSPQQCLQCGQSSCSTEGGNCLGDATCGQWFQCIQGCQDSACATTCDNQFPNAAPLYGPLYTCLCNGCPSECGFLDPCNH